MLTISQQTHAARYRLQYYQVGQVSKFVQPGAVRIASPRSVTDYQTATTYGVTPGVDNVAFLNPDGTKVAIVYNHSTTRRAFAIGWRGTYFSYALAPKAVVTFRWR